MTHLACADEPGHPLNAAQAARFAAICASVGSSPPPVERAPASQRIVTRGPASAISTGVVMAIFSERVSTGVVIAIFVPPPSRARFSPKM